MNTYLLTTIKITIAALFLLNIPLIMAQPSICSEGSNEAQQGAFIIGYTATFETVGNDVTISFELFDNERIGVVAYLWQQDPFEETEMTNVSGLLFSKTIEGLKTDSVITYACKFGFQGGLSVTKYFNYTVGSNCTNDTDPPTSFTASVGAVSAFSVEVLLSGSDNAGKVIYDISYGDNLKTTAGNSGAQKSYTLSGLTAETPYSFSVTARDLLGNTAANNPILLEATTAVDTNTECSGSSPAAQQEAFTIGYTYDFKTIGTDVTATFKLLDTDKQGVEAFLWQQTPFTETKMEQVSGLTFTKTLSGFTTGETINLACKFAFAGGLAVTKYFSYEVGNNCYPATLNEYSFKESIEIYPNPASTLLHINSPLSPLTRVEIFTVDGKRSNVYLANLDGLIIADLPNGLYLIKMYSEKGIVTQKFIKE